MQTPVSVGESMQPSMSPVQSLAVVGMGTPTQQGIKVAKQYYCNHCVPPKVTIDDQNIR